MRASGAALAAGILLVGTATVGTAAADPVSSCTTTTGAIVAVDFGHWGGPVVRGCDAHPSTGIKLLTNSGFTTTGTQHDGPQFLCRIGNPAWKGGTQYPTPADEACVLTPPATAYWSFWLAPAGQNTWTYSPLGAYADHPKNGEVEAWTFGGTDIAGTKGQPSFPPSAVRPKAAGSRGSSGGGSTGPETGTAAGSSPGANESPGAGDVGSSDRATQHRSEDPTSTAALRRTAGPRRSTVDPGPGTGSAVHSSDPTVGPAAPRSSATGTHRSGATAKARRATARPPATTSAHGSGATSPSHIRLVDSAGRPDRKSNAGGGSQWPLFLGGGLILAFGATGGLIARRRRRG